MAELLDAVEICRRLGPDRWHPATEVLAGQLTFYTRNLSVKVFVGELLLSDLFPVVNGEEDTRWIHASISRRSGMPSYDDLKLLHSAVWGDTGHSYQCFVPPSKHINIHSRALHLWGRADGEAVLPNFGMYGTI